jgi:hypothetical protein
MSYGDNKWSTKEKITKDKLNDMTLTSTNPFQLPAYYLANIDSKIDNILATYTKDSFNFAFATDLHTSSNSYVDNVIAYAAYANNLNLDALLLGGDYQDGATIKSTSLKRIREVLQILKKENTIPILPSKGNHDTNCYYAEAQNDLTQVMTNKEFYMAAIKHAEKYSIVTNSAQPYGGYYYKDFEDKKIRVICLNNNEAREIDGVPTAFDYFYMTSSQYKWFAEVALNFQTKETPGDWHVIAFSHSIPVDGPQFQSYMTQNIVIESIIQNFKAGTDYASETHGINAQFSLQGAGNFICYISGHVHLDVHSLVNNINYITVNSMKPQKRWTSEPVSAERIIYSESMNSITIFSIDKTTKSVTTKKIGAGSEYQFAY